MTIIPKTFFVKKKHVPKTLFDWNLFEYDCQGTKMSRREELETPTYTNSVPGSS